MPDCGSTNTFDGGIEVSCKISHLGSTLGFYGATPIAKPSSLTAPNTSVIGTIFTITESGVLGNTRTRVNEIEARLQSLGLLS